MRTYFFICHISGRAAVLQLHLLALLLATVAIVVVNVSVDCTIAVAVAVIVTVMYPLWTHAMTVVIAIDSVDMTRRPITFLPHHRRPLSRPAVVVASLASASPCLQLVVVGRINCYHHLHLASYCGQRHVGHLGWRVLLVDHQDHHHLQLACG